ncbi:molybdenum cofactor guanylyltransferase [Saccharibacillus sp. JS10]|uniref:molybdenum cofactor guanylyltransferase n=1 Tax=Saccharibacillus sp. JS10 TaxID=2950552 RepID=UPI0021086718|nr:molybdenum cofactor guanylyltransferase [Saccharibacillus sp. JS10]MCQ4085479.1 molybdenum cofactor guanylyltransferase [Saccharibacillus sp. JS10]
MSERSNNISPIIGIVLAGGLSRRFGSPKAFAAFSTPDGEESLFHERSVSALQRICESIVIVTNPELKERFPANLKLCIDLPQVAGQGPLAGIYTGMKQYPDCSYVIMPCDMPAIEPADIQKLHQLAVSLPDADVVAVRTSTSDIPLLSIWRRDLSQELLSHISSGQRSVMKLLAELHTHWIDSADINDNEQVFRNYNTPDGHLIEPNEHRRKS